MKYHLYLASLLTILGAGELKSFPSFQGFQGVGNTPTAEVLKEGELEVLYTNQVDDFSPSASTDFREDKEQDNYFLNVGLLPNLDISMRYSNATNLFTDSDYLSDRILSFKYQLPFISEDIAQVAFGMQDVGGGAPHLRSTYGVVSKEIASFRGSLGYAIGDDPGALDGVFGSIEYQPFHWLQSGFQVGIEYDTREWNGVVKAEYSTSIGDQEINLGAMAKSSLENTDLYVGFYASIPFDDRPQSSEASKMSLATTSTELKGLGFSNVSYTVEEDTLWFSYENTVYGRNDMDALGVVLSRLVRSDKAENIIVTVKKSNVDRFSVKVSSQAYKTFLESGVYTPNLLDFTYDSIGKNTKAYASDRFRPTITLQPDFILVDGSEYGNMDYTISLQADVAMRLAKGTTISGRLNVPIAISDNFDEGGIFDYRNRNKTDIGFDQAILSQFMQADTDYPLMGLLQVGMFDKDLNGISFESAVSDKSGKHLFMLKLAYLQDDLYKEMDGYSDTDTRELKLLSYRYYWDTLNSDIKITGGEFLYGDRGASLTLKRYFSDVTMQFDLSRTTHDLRGDNTVGRITLSIPLGAKKRYKSEYFDVDVGDLNYERRKTVVSEGETSFAQPLHLTEIQNSHTLENYYLDSGRLHSGYIQENSHRLRDSSLED